MANVTMDAMDPKSKGLAKLLKKNNVKMEILTMRGPSGWPEVELTGKREDLEVVLADSEYGWDDPELAEYIEEGASVNESKITLKRKYTENHPAITVGKAARIRNKVIEAIADGTLTEEEFNNILSEYSANAKQWMKRNSRFFNVSEEGIALSKFGKKALSAVVVNEEESVNENYEVIYSDGISAGKKFRTEAQALDFMKKTIASNKKLRDIAVYKPGMHSTTQTELVVKFWGNGSYLDNVSKKDPKLAAKKLEESEYIEEGNAFGAARAKAIADGKDEFTVDGETYKVKSVDKEDKENAKDFKGESFVYESFSSFVESLNETESLNEAFKSMKLAQLLTPKKKSSWNKGIAQEFYNYTQVKLDKVEDHDLLEVDPQTAYKQKGGTKVKFFLIDNDKQSPYTDDNYDGRIQAGLIAVLNGNNDFMGAVYRRFSSEKGRILTKTDKADSLGVDKRRKGYGATGLSSAKRIADFADRAIVIDVDILRQRYSAQQQKDSRSAAKKGAIAFKTDKEFKAENVARYNEILANKAAALPLDKMVKDAIDKLADQIKEGVAKGEKGRYGDIIIGKNSKGNEAKMRDASNHMSNILDDYGRYVDYITQAEREKEEWGKTNSYYEEESKNYAKNVKDKINKIDTFDYAW